MKLNDLCSLKKGKNKQKKPHFRWLRHEADWENAKSVQSGHQSKCGKGGKWSKIWNIFWFNTFHLLHHLMCSFMVLRKNIEWEGMSKLLAGTVLLLSLKISCFTPYFSLKNAQNAKRLKMVQICAEAIHHSNTFWSPQSTQRAFWKGFDNCCINTL